MDLNENADHGLDAAFDVSKHLDLGNAPSATPGGDLSTKSQTKTFVTSATNPTDYAQPSTTNVLGQSAQPGALPDIKAKFAIVDEHTTHILDLTDIDETLGANSSVSQEDAKYINTRISQEGISPLNVKEYTLGKSKTNLAYTRKFLQRQISQEQIRLRDAFMTVVQMPFYELEDSGETIQSALEYAKRYLTKVTERFEAISGKHAEAYKDILESKNNVFEVNGGFTNILKEPLSQAALVLSKGIKEKGAIDGLIAVTKCSLFLDFITRSSLDFGDLPLQPTALAPLVESANSITLTHFLQYYQEKGLQQRSPGFSSLIESCANYIESVRVKANDMGADPIFVQEIVAEELAAMQAYVEKTHYIHEVLRNHSIMNFAMDIILEFLSRNR